MAKDNLFLGFARGSVGDVTFTRLNGRQVARARNRAPRNPQSPLQLLQRVILATAGKAYSAFQAICDHSFQGLQQGTGNQSRFMQTNIAMLRDKISTLIASPTEENILGSAIYNFANAGATLPVANEYILSEGTLPSVSVVAPSAVSQPLFRLLTVEATNPLSITYQQVVEALGAQEGDQLTLLAVAHKYSGFDFDNGPSINNFEFARIILQPSTGSMAAPFLQQTSDGLLTVNAPNERNEGTVTFSIANSGMLVESVNTLDGTAAGADNWIAGFSAVLSRLVGGTWARSNSQLVLNAIPSLLLNWGTISEAYSSYKIDQPSSNLYLNQGRVSAVNLSDGGAVSFVADPSNSAHHIPSSLGVVPIAIFGGREYYAYSAQASPSSSDAVVFAEGSTALTALRANGYQTYVVGTWDAAGDAAYTSAVMAINNWFTPTAGFYIETRP